VGWGCDVRIGRYHTRKVDLMNDSDLTAFQASQLQYLRSEVDRAQDDSLRSDPPPDAHNKLFYARNELKAFTSNLRASGKNI
jgi:hypothetical protein